MGSGGAEHQVATLTTMLSGKGYNTEVVTFSGQKDHYQLDGRVNRIRIAHNSNRLVKLLSIFWFFLTHKTDCVISFGQRVNLLCIIPLLLRPRVKVIAGERNFTVGEPDKIERMLFKYLYKRANFIVPNSYSQGEHILACNPEYADKVITIINYTDTEQYTYSLPIRRDIVNIGVFCRYDKQKNYERFAVVVKMLKDCGCQLHIDWYGSVENDKGGYNQDYLKFKTLVKEYGIGDIIQLHNHINNVRDLMPQYDALCLPSLYEGWSNTISEGICCGRPMLVSDVSDNNRMVRHRENGVLFDPIDENSIYNAFVEFLALSYADRLQMGERSREIACELFDADKFVDSYIGLIEN